MAPGDLTSRFARQRRGVALIAAVLLTLVTAYAVLLSLSPPDSATSTRMGAEVLAMACALFGVSCAGIAATAKPSQCLGLLSLRGPRRKVRDPDPTDTSPPFPLVAHHCSCGRFADHTVRLGGRTFCAGCLGMAAGGASGIGLAVASGAGLLFFDNTTSLTLTLVAGALGAAGLVVLYRGSRPGWHVAANFALVSGAVLLAVLLSSHGLVAGAFGLLAALAVVGLRIEMSRWRHLAVYAGCPWQEACRGSSALGAARGPTR